MKFRGKVGNGPVNRWLNIGGDGITVWAQVFFWIRHYWEIRKVANRNSFILIRQMAALIRRALVDVYTAPVLLV